MVLARPYGVLDRLRDLRPILQLGHRRFLLGLPRPHEFLGRLSPLERRLQRAFRIAERVEFVASHSAPCRRGVRAKNPRPGNHSNSALTHRPDFPQCVRIELDGTKRCTLF